jgi:RNA polymerase sigma-70 factor (TIGR02952 family)
MSSYAVPGQTAGLRALLAAVIAHRTAARPTGPPDGEAGPYRTSLAGDDVSAPEPGGTPQAAGAGSAPSGGGAEPGGEAWTLVRAAQGGDAEAFGRLYDRYVDLVFRYAYHRLGDRTVAEDVTSETFLRALRRIGSLTYQGRDVGAWFVTIARNLVLDHVKSGRHRLEITTGDLRDADQAADSPEATVLERLTNAALLRCVRQLGAEQQECIVLRFLHGLSVAETAAIMDKNEGAIKALQHRAVRRLAALLPADPR